MTIVDRMAEKLPGLRRLLAGAHIIEAPFPVAPYDDSDGKPGILWTGERIPRGLYRQGAHGTESSLANPPYPVTAIFSSAPSDCGIILAHAERCHDWAELVALYPAEHRARLAASLPEVGMVRWKVFVGLVALFGANLVVSPVRAWVGSYAVKHPIHSKQMLEAAIERRDPTDEVQLRQYLEHGLSWGLKLSAMLLNEDPSRWLNRLRLATTEALASESLHRMNDADWALDTAIVLWTLMNAGNLARVEVIPPHDRASRRRGEPPPYRYHVLRVAGAPRQRGVDLSRGEPVDHLPIHWVRGHLKTYGTDGRRRLFGRLQGCYWWQPHLAGRRRDAVVDKDYAVERAP